MSLSTALISVVLGVATGLVQGTPGGVLVWGGRNVPSLMPMHASMLYARNVLNLLRLLLPCAFLFSAVISFQAYYDWRVTGSAATLPYTLHERQYAPAPERRRDPDSGRPHPGQRYPQREYRPRSGGPSAAGPFIRHPAHRSREG